MADAASALASPSAAASLSGDPNLDKIIKAQPKRVEDLQAKRKEYADKLESVEGAASDQLHKDQGEIDSLRPPKMEIPPQPIAQSTDPVHMWGSAAMLLATIGSLSTRSSLTTALNAAGKVLTAYRSNDQAAADAAFKTWEVATKNAVEMSKYQLDQYKEIIKGIEHRQDLTEKEAGRMEKDATAEWAATAASFSDTTAAELVMSHGIEAGKKLVIDREAALQKIDQAAPKLAMNHSIVSGLDAFHKTREYKAADPQARAAMDADWWVKHSPGAYTFSAPQKAHAEDGVRNHLESSVLGKNYASAATNLQTVMSTPPEGGVINDSAQLDAYIQTINGGRAIRGFQAKMNTEHSGLWNRLEIGARQLTVGGMLSPQMVHDLKMVSVEIAKEREDQYAEAIKRAQEQAKHRGLDPDEVVPYGYEPSAIEKIVGEDPAGKEALAKSAARSGGGQHPSPVKVPAKFASQPDGTKLRNGGWIWEKHGDQLVPVGREQ